MSLSITTECLLCHFSRNVKKARTMGDEATALAFSRDLMRLYLESPEDVSSPWFNPGVDALLKRYYGIEGDVYAQEKAAANRFVMERFGQISAMAEQAEDPVLAGLQLSILGNYLDFGALQDRVSFAELEDMLKKALQMELDMDCYRSLRGDLEKGKKLLYLTDNAGEIGFDRIFAQQIHKAYPHLEITFCVRGGNTLNDATREDAALVGIPFPVIDNGNLISGTELSQLGEEAKTAMATADVIIAKGMANTETLFGSGYPVYYAFLVKCVRFVQQFQKPLMTPMLVREPT